MTQDQLAEALEVSSAFISRVRTKERSFTIDHLTALEALLKVPASASFLAAVPLPGFPAGNQEVARISAKSNCEQADVAAGLLSARRAALVGPLTPPFESAGRDRADSDDPLVYRLCPARHSRKECRPPPHAARIVSVSLVLAVA